MKYILHIDMNAFFASVEEIKNPEYLNKPIAVGGRTRRSVVASANYIARQKGIKAAMPIYVAKYMCPKLIIIDGHFNLYREYSEKFNKLINDNITNKIEQFSIDECYVDITNLVTNEKEALELAKKIQLLIYDNLKLKCSIGVSYNKFLAKMASDLKKPMGITTLFQQDIKTKLWPIDIKNMLWIGEKTSKLLKKNNINTIGDLANPQNNQTIKKLLDKNWYTHIQHANGLGSDELDFVHELPKSISAAETFLFDTDDYDEIIKTMKVLTQDITKRLNKYNLYTRTFTVYVKMPDFKQKNKSLTTNYHTNLYDEIWFNLLSIYQEHFQNKLIRLIGVKIDNLSQQEFNLFNYCDQH